VPSENELGEQFQISRTTVRQALGDLVNQGHLMRIQGKGTFVAPPRVQQYLQSLTSFTQDMQIRQWKSGSIVVQFNVNRSTQPVADALQLKTGDPVIVLKRIRTAEGQPMAVETAHLPYQSFPALIELDMTYQSLYDTLKSKFNVMPTRAVQQMEAVACPVEDAQQLGVHKASPVLHIYRTTYSQDGRPFEFVESYYRSDRYIFSIEIWSK